VLVTCRKYEPLDLLSPAHLVAKKERGIHAHQEREVLALSRPPFAALGSQRTVGVGAKCRFRTAKTLTPNSLPHHRTRFSTALIPSMAESALQLVSEIGSQLGRQTRSSKDSLLKLLKVSRYCYVCVHTKQYICEIIRCGLCLR
jgi:hypothetical protein